FLNVSISINFIYVKERLVCLNRISQFIQLKLKSIITAFVDIVCNQSDVISPSSVRFFVIIIKNLLNHFFCLLSSAHKHSSYSYICLITSIGNKTFVFVHHPEETIRTILSFTKSRVSVSVIRLENRNDIGVALNSVVKIIRSIPEKVKVFYSFRRSRSIVINISHKVFYGSNVLLSGRKFVINIF